MRERGEILFTVRKNRGPKKRMGTIMCLKELGTVYDFLPDSKTKE